MEMTDLLSAATARKQRESRLGALLKGGGRQADLQLKYSNA